MAATSPLSRVTSSGRSVRGPVSVPEVPVDGMASGATGL